MANSKKSVEKRFTIFEQEKNNRQKAIEFLKKMNQDDKNRNNK